jgi:hypothetical protein
MPPIARIPQINLLTCVAMMPTVFAPHGGGPWPFIKDPFGDPEELNDLARYLRHSLEAEIIGFSLLLVANERYSLERSHQHGEA